MTLLVTYGYLQERLSLYRKAVQRLALVANRMFQILPPSWGGALSP